MLAAGITGAIAILFFVWGLLLTRGHLLNTIAGNNYVTKDQYNDPRQRGLGKRVGGTLISTSVWSWLLTLVLIFTSLGNSYLCNLFLLLMYLSIIPVLIFGILSFRWSFKNFK